MIRSQFVTTVAIVVPFMIGAASCAGTTKNAQSVQDVDDLLTRIERVQVDATVAKDKAREALAHLTTLVSPNFAGDATKAFADFEHAIENSETHTLAFRNSIHPMKQSAEDVFLRWTTDLENFGNTRMRQRSQNRLDDTRARYQTVLTASQSVLVTLEAFNSDINDQALFLASDLNSASVQAIHPEVRDLHERAKELDNRVDACSAAARAYVESAALYGQVEAAPGETQATPTDNTTGDAQGTQSPTKTKFVKQRSSTLKPRATPNATPETTTPTPVVNDTPVTTPENTPNPQQPQ